MSLIERSGDAIVIDANEAEVAALESLVHQLMSILGADQVPPASDDPFAAWEAELSLDQLDTSDPVIARLFPRAYADDAADADFRRFTEGAQRRSRIDRARVVEAGLRATDSGTEPIRIPDAELSDWLMTLNAIRLSLSVRLGIETAADAERLDQELDRVELAVDQRALVYGVYQWLGHLLEWLIELS